MLFKIISQIKIIQCDYFQLTWMTENIKKYLKERYQWSIYMYTFLKNRQRESDHAKVLKKSLEYNRETFEVIKKFNLKMRNKLEDPNTAPKRYQTILIGL